MMDAGTVMSSKVVTIDESSSLEDAVNLLARHRISGVPVVDKEGKIVGIISEKDILAFAEGENIIPFTSLAGFVAQDPELKNISILRKSMAVMAQTAVEKVMTKKVITVKEDTPIAEVARIMSRHQINRVPVVGEDNRLRGIITRADVVKFLAEKEQNLR